METTAKFLELSNETLMEKIKQNVIWKGVKRENEMN